MARYGRMWPVLIFLILINILGILFLNNNKKNIDIEHFSSISIPDASLKPFAANFVNYDTNVPYSLINNVIFDTPDPSHRTAMITQMNNINASLGNYILSQMPSWILFSNAANFGGTLFFIYPTNGVFDMNSTMLSLMNIYNGNSISYYIPLAYTVTLTYDKTVPDIPTNSSKAVMDAQIDALSQKTVSLVGTNTNYLIPDLFNIISMTIALV